jgi:hypothetical protein
VEVIERGPGPEPPLWADGLPKPPILEGGPCVRGWESHRGAVILVLSLLLFCELEGHRVGTGPDSRVQCRKGVAVRDHHLGFSPTQGTGHAEPIHLLSLRYPMLTL